MASCLQKIPSGNESRAEGENDEMGIPNYRERSRLNNKSASATLTFWAGDRILWQFMVLENLSIKDQF